MRGARLYDIIESLACMESVHKNERNNRGGDKCQKPQRS
jgi:hypothetical protein